MSEITTTEQRDPVVQYVRPIADIMEQMRFIIDAIGIPVHVYTGTNLDDLSKRIAGALAQSGGAPVSVVCYAGSSFANHPRRTSRFNIVVVSGDTRVNPGMPGALEQAWKIEGALDRLVSQDTAGGCPQTDILEVEGEETVQLKDAGAACAIVVSIIAKDY